MTAGEISEDALTTLWKISHQFRKFFFSKLSFQIQLKILACAHIKITAHVALSLITLVICFYKVTSITSALVYTLGTHGHTQCKKEQGNIMHKNT